MMGLQIGDYNIALDVRDPQANVNFVSHAHSDHTSGLCKTKDVISSRITRDLIEARSKKKVKLADNLHDIELLNAGHILGSRQLYAVSESDGCSILYSGDYQMQESCVAERIEIKEADVLIIDSTYPDKDTIFEERNEVVTSIQHYIEKKLQKGIILFGSYALGKAQELIRIANEVGIAPVVDEKISMINKIYESFGVRLEYISQTHCEEEFNASIMRNFVGITEASKLNLAKERLGALYNKRIFSAVTTGFAKMFNFGTDVQFALSDHADFKQAIEYIDACNPKKIYTYGRYSNTALLASNLCDIGYDAYAFDPQKGITLH